MRNPPPAPKSERASSYSLRLVSLPSTSYASEASLKRASALGSFSLESGWFFFASLRNAFLMSSCDASLGTPRTL